MSTEPRNWLDPGRRRTAYAILALYNKGAHRGSVELVGSLDEAELAETLLAMTDLTNRLLASWVRESGAGRKAADRGVDVSELMAHYLQELLLAAAVEEAG